MVSTLKLNINPFDAENPMSWRDAATISLIAAFAVWILTFLVNATMGQIRADPEEFVFEAVKAYAIAWAGNFITLAGLSQLVEKVRAESATPD